MATDKKLAGLPEASAFGLTDEIYIEQGGTSLRAPAPAELLLAARTLYVRKTGSNSNNGLSNTDGGAFQTVQHALNVAAQFDNRLYPVTVSIADGTYAEDLTVQIAGISQMDSGSIGIYIVGNTATPANVVVQGLYVFNSSLDVRGLTFTGLFYVDHSYCNLQQCRHQASTIQAFESQLDISVSLTVTGSVAQQLLCAGHSTITAFGVITVSGTPAYSTAFALAKTGGNIVFASQPTGAATGPRYFASRNGLIDTGGGGASYLPGNSAGSTDTGGQYL